LINHDKGNDTDVLEMGGFKSCTELTIALLFNSSGTPEINSIDVHSEMYRAPQHP